VSSIHIGFQNERPCYGQRKEESNQAQNGRDLPLKPLRKTTSRTSPKVCEAICNRSLAISGINPPSISLTRIPLSSIGNHKHVFEACSASTCTTPFCARRWSPRKACVRTLPFGKGKALLSPEGVWYEKCIVILHFMNRVKSITWDSPVLTIKGQRDFSNVPNDLACSWKTWCFQSFPGLHTIDHSGQTFEPGWTGALYTLEYLYPCVLLPSIWAGQWNWLGFANIGSLGLYRENKAWSTRGQVNASEKAFFVENAFMRSKWCLATLGAACSAPIWTWIDAPLTPSA